MDSEQFGQRKPPLSVTIKKILERYSDGQIFKEMIQNADDAGAKTVWFYVDERQHRSSNLPHTGLAKFQGPALVAANDACFTEEDWEGIQSLQQSIKAHDPFKVGRFGIGFNSVYHLTDLPIIVSGNRLACFEPQEKIWRNESGQSFNLTTLINQHSDVIAPLGGLANFNASTISQNTSYSHTLFRLPLRTEVSGLSENIYTIQALHKLLDALREEAKFLLLFLNSVCKIEVIHVSQTGQQSLSFCVEIVPADRAAICSQRESFMQQLQSAHRRQPHRISNVISFSARFSVVVTDQNPRSNQAGTSEWIVANYVGSEEASVQSAAKEQKTFPWVGAALELGTATLRGRIFCFLPMPVETSSGLPIHVNGTFGLNDERCTLKWPGVERRNDPTAKWNKILVSQLLPHCYTVLLREAKTHLSHEQFYKAWPKVKVVKRTQFAEILQPLFASLFKETVVRTKRTEVLRQIGEWIFISQAIFISEGGTLPSVVCRALSHCGGKLVTVPSNIWAAIRHNGVEVTEVSPQLVRDKLRSYSQSYTSIDPISKRELLQYCLTDECYHDLTGLHLLPLANNSFTSFDNAYGTQLVYLCTEDCPRSLLPNIDHLLVDLSDDLDLQESIYQVAFSQHTKLRILTESEVARLLPQAMPSEWHSRTLAVMPNAHLPFNWLETFWKWLWLQNRNLQLFRNQLIIPVYQSTSQNRESFCITRLDTQSPVVYINTYRACSSSVLSSLYKMNVMVCQQSEFGYVQHRQLAKYMMQFDTNGVLDAIAHQSTYSKTAFTQEEADSLRTFLASSTYSPNSRRRAVLQSLCIFSSASNSSGKLYSFSNVSAQSVTRKALGEPANSSISVANLPSNLILFSRSNYYQLQLLQNLQVTFHTDTRLLLDYIFPLIRNCSFPDHLMDSLMKEVVDVYQVLNSKDYNITTAIQNLPFLRTASGRCKTPNELFDPSNEEIKALYNGEDVFPLAPFNTVQRLHVLRYCGLQTSVLPQQVLDIVHSISVSSSSQPQRVSPTRFSRAKAVLEYISTNKFQRQISGYTCNYRVPSSRNAASFSGALYHLATNRSWLPVMSSSPQGYPEQLSWKGSSYSSHFVSLAGLAVVVSQYDPQNLPCLVGTQMYIVTPPVSPTVVSMLPIHTEVIAQHVVAHFQETLAYKDCLPIDMMYTLVHTVYSYLNTNSSHCRHLYSVQEWIYIKRQNKFVSPAVVALQQNQTFRQNLEPYVYILPDTLSPYRNLFASASGVSQSVSQSQILSVLKMIRDDDQTGSQRSHAKEAWDTVMRILNWLTSNGTKDVPFIGDKDMLVPVESNSSWPSLVRASEVVYTDNDFLKTFLQDSDESDSYTFVHDNVNPRLAKCLGVVPLTEFLDISEDTFEDAGQHEPLTVRLKNILKVYKDGPTIIKELLQNADDAEATEVNICYDARQHEQDPNKLFFSGMAEAHGPALIVHNNKTFTDDDFINITKLAGATKQAKALKIGKFGVGFCSVYHMTDVPSFISRDRLYIFDPTLSYLKKEIKNPGQPGKKTVFTNKFIARSKQLSPYDGLFGFDRNSSYEGTMFRLPFRTSASELSGKCYSEATVQKLINKCHSSILLFLQHLKSVTFLRINPGETSPSVILRITRDCIPMPISLPAGIELRRLSCTQESLSVTSDCKWLVSQQSEFDLQGKLSTASIACLLEQAGNTSVYKVDPSLQGEIFCFLPLSQKTGLPVHVSSNFAVTNNRREIQTSDDATYQTDTEVRWNVSLMQGVIPEAYHVLLVSLKQMKIKGCLQDYLFHCLWPPFKEKHNLWSVMISQLYQRISSDDLFFSTYQNQWLHLSACKFLQPGILCQSLQKLTTPSCVLHVLQYLHLPIVDIPGEHLAYLDLEDLTIDEAKFIELFFKHFHSLEGILVERNMVIQCMLEVFAADYDNQTSRFDILNSYFKTHSCIPCCPDGTVLRKGDEIVDPSAQFAGLYDLEDAQFPIESLTKRELVSAALHKF